jgi:protease I
MALTVLLIIAFNQFRDEEYAIPKEIFTNASIMVTTASSQLGIATGKLGLKTKVDITLDQIEVKKYDAVLFIGGPGSFAYYDNPLCHKIAQAAVKAEKILGGICAAPGILAKAGVLKGKKATMFADTGVMAENGATFINQGVVTDGTIITATGPETAKAWSETILKVLDGKL